MGCKKNDQQMIDIGAAPKTCSSYDFPNPQKKARCVFRAEKNFGKVKNLLSALDKHHKLIDL